jgi:hypothetical protein
MQTLRAAVDGLMFSLESMSYDPSLLAVILCGITRTGIRTEIVHRIAVRYDVSMLALLHAVADRAATDESVPQNVRDVCAALKVIIEEEMRRAGAANG